NTGGTVVVNATGSVTATGDYVQTGATARTTLNGGGISANLVDLQGGVLDGNGYTHGSLQNAATITIGGAGAAGYLYGPGRHHTQTASGVLNVEIGGLEYGTQYDVLYLEGTATLAGTLNVSLLGGYVPNPDDVFHCVYAEGTRSGEFDTVNGLILSDTLAFYP